MSLKRVKGNLLDLAEAGEFDVVVQGCNCWNTMGGGIAKEIASRYPQALLADNETVKGDYNKLGNYTIARANVAEFDIVNAYTQFNMSTGEDVFEYVLRNKKAEWAEYRRQVSAYELDRYLPVL